MSVRECVCVNVFYTMGINDPTGLMKSSKTILW